MIFIACITYVCLASVVLPTLMFFDFSIWFLFVDAMVRFEMPAASRWLTYRTMYFLLWRFGLCLNFSNSQNDFVIMKRHCIILLSTIYIDLVESKFVQFPPSLLLVRPFSWHEAVRCASTENRNLAYLWCRCWCAKGFFFSWSITYLSKSLFARLWMITVQSNGSSRGKRLEAVSGTHMLSVLCFEVFRCDVGHGTSMFVVTHAPAWAETSHVSRVYRRWKAAITLLWLPSNRSESCDPPL